MVWKRIGRGYKGLEGSGRKGFKWFGRGKRLLEGRERGRIKWF